MLPSGNLDISNVEELMENLEIKFTEVGINLNVESRLNNNLKLSVASLWTSYSNLSINGKLFNNFGRIDILAEAVQGIFGPKNNWDIYSVDNGNLGVNLMGQTNFSDLTIVLGVFVPLIYRGSFRINPTLRAKYTYPTKFVDLDLDLKLKLKSDVIILDFTMMFSYKISNKIYVAPYINIVTTPQINSIDLLKFGGISIRF